MVRPSLFVDSVTLMKVADELGRLPDVTRAVLVMGTPANRTALTEAGLWSDAAADARTEDLVVAVRARSAEAARHALERAEKLLGARRAETAAELERPRSILVAARHAPAARLAVISTPGSFAAAEVHQALSAGLHVFLFSDGVDLADEVALKRRADQLGLLVMGPECGTAIIGGVGLGFANRVRSGPIGLVGASGTGLQEVSTLVHRSGGGVSHAIGTGGRDLHDAVGGATTKRALARLATDNATRAIVLVSKPGSDRVAADVLATAAGTGKPVIACLLGWRGRAPGGVRVADTLEEAACAAVEALGGAAPAFKAPNVPVTPARRPSRIRGLFVGGTLCEEARVLTADAAETFIDFGSSEYTRGRPHPMIAPDLRSAAIAATGDAADVGVLLVDFVLGLCAHPDPVGAAASAIQDAQSRARRAGRTLHVVAHVVGTDDDPQKLTAQEEGLRALDVVVCPTNRLAAETARRLASRNAG
jgi:succinyl-CoA synthetase alpha subunit